MLIFLLKYATLLIKIETSYDAMEDRVDCITVSLCRKVILRDTVEAKCMQNLRPQTKRVSILMILLIDKCWQVFQLRDI